MQEVTVGLLKAAMLDHPESVGYLIDGFPRELEQGELFKQQVYTGIQIHIIYYTIATSSC